MKRTEQVIILPALWLTAWAATPARGQQPIRYEPSWESLKQYRAPQWYEDAKFGIFIHWGVYAVPAFGNEWYPRNMYLRYSTNWRTGESSDREQPEYKHHLERWGPQSRFGYKDFIPMFKAGQWDPERWAELFKKSGARYVVPVATHHDGFAMYASSHTKWNSARMGPRRDILGELAQAVRKRGLKFGASSHYAFNWRYYPHSDEFDTNDPENFGLYNRPHSPRAPADNEFLELWYASTKEIVDKYHPDVLWFDFGFNEPEFEPYRRKIAAYYYNEAQRWGGQGVLNYKHQAFPDGTAVLDIERGKLDRIREMVWQTDTSISRKSWGYIENDEFKSADSLIDDLVDIVSKNGVLLLNVGPKADGTIPAEARSRLLEIGRWLKLNGEAIYGTRPWKVFGEGPTKMAAGHMSERKNQPFTAHDIRFTTKGDTLYAIVLDWPEERLTIGSLASGSTLNAAEIHSVRLLGARRDSKWRQGRDGLTIDLPPSKPGDYAHVFKITFR